MCLILAEAYPGPAQKSKMEKAVSYWCKAPHFRRLRGSWLNLWLEVLYLNTVALSATDKIQAKTSLEQFFRTKFAV